MNEEKKLTDEEIAKAILQSIEYSKTITYFDEWGNCKSIFVKDALDLIHRLQDENDRLNDMKFTQEHCDLYKENEWLKAELKRELSEHEEFTKKAKAEIESLKCDSYKTSWKAKFLEAKKEIERLTEELDLANETIDRNNKRYEKVSIERQKALDRVDFLEDALLDKIRRNEEIITAIKQAEQQAVKDTAKEIQQLLHDLGGCDATDEWSKGWDKAIDTAYEGIKTRYGVEVE